MEIASKILKQAPVKWKSLKWLQNSNLKDIPADALGKLKKSLTENDFIQPFNVWQDSKGTIWILDGHHREKALKELEAEGVTIPEELPANFINCKTKKDAAKLVLVYSSIYAKVNYEGLTQFIDDFSLDIDYIQSELDIPNIDLGSLYLEIDNSSKNKEIDPETLTKDLNIKCPRCGFEFHSEEEPNE